MRSDRTSILQRLGGIRRATRRLSQRTPQGTGWLGRLKRAAGSLRQQAAAVARSAATALGISTAILQLRRVARFTADELLPPISKKAGRWLWRRLRALPTALGVGDVRAWAKALPGRLRDTVLASLYRLVQRQGDLVRRFAKPLADPSWRLARSGLGIRYLDAATRLERVRPRLVSRLMFRVAHFVHITTLGVQIAAGHTERSLQLARTLNLMHRHVVRARQRPGCHMYFEALFRTMRFDRIVKEMPEIEPLEDHYLNHEVGTAHLYALDAPRAISFLRRAIEINSGSYIDHRMLGRAHLVNGDVVRAKLAFHRSVQLVPATVMAHQNYAGRYDIQNYEPKPLELERAGQLLVYDNLGQFAEDLFLQGRFHESFQFYQRMLDYQKELAVGFVLPADLTRRLAATGPRFDDRKPVRLLPYEWVVQFGHIGLLDIYMKMAKLGMYPDANFVVLAPKAKVANADYLAYWDQHYTIVRDTALVDDLFPYQRYIGDNFMAYPAEGGEAEPWTRAGARAQVLWAEQKRAPLLTLADRDRAIGEKALAELGVPRDAWYVGLHVREGGFYAEASTGISTHRNASIEDYLPAIQEITARGGWVIRLGDKSMRPMQPMKNVVDYAVSRQKSTAMDLFLLATSRMVIGTTSGLTTACLSFGRPMVLVNAISNDWQLWSDDTDFITKRLTDRRSGRILSFGETYRQPIQGYLINNVVTHRKGYAIVPNTADEIREAVAYKLDILDGRIERPQRNHHLMGSYWREMAHNRFMFGAAHPVAPFLARAGSLSTPVQRLQPAA